MRILFIVEHFPCISETFVLNQVTGLLDLGHDVEVYAVGKPVAPVVHPDFKKYDLQARTWAGPNNPSTRLRRVAHAVAQLPQCFRRFPLPTLQAFNVFRYGRPAANLYLFYSLLPFLQNRPEFDIVHCHFGDKGVLAQIWRELGLLSGRMTVVFHAHEMAGLPDEKGRTLYAKLFRSDALLLPISNHWREVLLRWGAQPEDTIVHHMGVDCEQIRFEPRTVRPSQPPHLLSVCRLTEMKGMEYSIRAVAQLRVRFPNLRYTIVGDGPLQSGLQELVDELNLKDNISFAGPQPQDKVRELLRSAHIFLAPSVTDSQGCTEGIPVALMEALAAGVPAVATRHAGIPELITDGVSGFLVKERNVLDLAQAVETLACSPTLCVSIARQGRVAVEREFNVRTQNRALEKAFQNHLASLPSKHRPAAPIPVARN